MNKTSVVAPKMKRHASSTYKFIALMAIVGLMMLLGIVALPYAKQFFLNEGRAVLIETIHNQGLLGMALFVLIQVVQIVIFIIPGEAVEVISGMIYGTWWGYVVCQIGIVIGSSVIFYMVKGLGYDFVHQFISESKFEKFKFLQNSKKVERLVLILFFIPGTPKDVLTYFIPFTELSLSRFLVISCVARVPAIVSSTFAGDSLQQGNVGTSIITFVLVAIVGCIGIWVNKKFLDKQQQV